MTVVNARPKKLDLELYEGDGFSFRLRYADDIDVSTRDYVAQVKEDGNDTPVATFTVTRPAPNEVLFTLAGTAVVPHDRLLRWDLQQTLPGGQPRTLVAGVVVIDSQVTT